MNRKLAIATLIILALITAGLASQLTKLKFNYIFEDFFPVDDPDLITYKEFVKKFENDNDYLLLGLIEEQSIFNETFLMKVDQLTNQLNNLEGVKSATSITTIEKPLISPAGVFSIPLVHLEDPSLLTQDSIRLFKQVELVETIVSKDAKSTLVVLKHAPLSSKEEADAFVDHVMTALDSYEFHDYFIAGKLYAQGVFIDKIQDELTTFLAASVILVLLFLCIAYRSWWGVLIPLLVVALGAIWILGLMAFLGKQLDLLMVLLPTIMFVVGMSDVVHLMTKYIENLRRGDPKKEAIKIALKEVGLATFLTSLTTSIGFLTLLTASIKPIQEFGIYTALGVFIAFIVAFTALPASWVILKEPEVSQRVTNRTVWFNFLGGSFLKVAKHRTVVVVISVAIVAISAIGISKIVINTYLIEDLPSDDPLKQSFTFFDDNFGGSRPFESIIEVKNHSATLFEENVAQEIEKVNNYLKDKHLVGGIISTNSLLKGLVQATNGGLPENYRLPSSKSEWKKIDKPLRRTLKKGELESQLHTSDLKTGRISGWVDDMGSKMSLRKNEEFKTYVTENVDTSLVNFTLTGTSNLIDKNNVYLAQNMLQGLGIAFGVVAIIAGLLFKSARMVLITLIPNVIPLMMVAGIMGFFDITLKLSTSIVFTIAFGIAVDDTIHFTSKLKLELNKGKSLLYALKRTYLSTGKAIIVTSIILSGGFLILILSSFGGTFYTGLLISLTLIFALIIDLTLLPALVILFFNKRVLKKHVSE